MRAILICITFLAITLPATAYSQSGQTRYGLLAGLNQTKLDTEIEFGSATLTGESSEMTSFTGSLFFNYSFNNQWGFEAGAGYGKRGWEANDVENTYTHAFAYAGARYWFHKNMSILGGFYHSEPQSKLTRKDKSDGSETEIEFSEFPNLPMQGSDGGIVLDFQVDFGGFLFGGRGLFGTKDIVDNTYVETTWTETQFYIGYAF